MKAVLYHEYGNINEVLKIEECPLPELKEDQVLVRVKAVGLNPRDVNIVEGKLSFVSGKKFPKGIGADFSGIIEKTGSNVAGFDVNDSVVGYIDSLDAGAVAEFVAVNYHSLVVKPKNVPYDIAASIPCNYLTAWLALNTSSKITKGQSVIIYGASGGVGTAAIQIANHLGAEVTAVCSSKNLEYCLSQGAKYAVSYNEFNDRSSQVKSYDVFFQVYSEGGLLYGKVKNAIAPKGSFITLIPNPVYIFRKLLNRLSGGPTFHYILVKSNQSVLKHLMELVEKEAIKPYISNEYGFDDFLLGLKLMKDGHSLGKNIIKIA